MKILCKSLLLLLGSGCALLETHLVPLGEPVQTHGTTMTVSLASPAKLIVFDQMRGSCRKAKKELKLTAKQIGGDAHGLKIQQCQGGKVRWESASFLPIGQYRLTLAPAKTRLVNHRPTAIAYYKYPDFSSDSDQVPEGALAWEAGRLEQSVNAQAGDRTDWIELKGEGITSVHLLHEPTVSLQADLYKIIRGKSQHLRRLQGSTAVNLTSGLYLRIRSHRYLGEVKYKLVRSEGGGQRTVQTDVFDIYPLNDQESIALLQKVENLTPKTTVQIFGERGSERKFLGVCLVETVDASGASCRMKGQVGRFDAFDAQFTVEG